MKGPTPAIAGAKNIGEVDNATLPQNTYD